MKVLGGWGERARKGARREKIILRAESELNTHDTQKQTTQESYYSKSSLISSFTVSCPGLNAGFPKWGHDAHLKASPL